uniref:Uncharacterized protein n=1 Tax=Cacopsylla melanoneura TaxID=428564 RepID=A0A8D8TME9_9HEMI
MKINMSDLHYQKPILEQKKTLNQAKMTRKLKKLKYKLQMTQNQRSQNSLMNQKRVQKRSRLLMELISQKQTKETACLIAKKQQTAVKKKAMELIRFKMKVKLLLEKRKSNKLTRSCLLKNNLHQQLKRKTISYSKCLRTVYKKTHKQ